LTVAKSDSDLPKNWERVTIGELCDLKNGYAFKPSDWSAKGLPIVRIQNLNNPNATFNHYMGDLRDRFIIEDGDLLFAWSGTPGTSFGAHIWRGGKAALNQHIFRIDFDESIINKNYFMLAINQKLNSLIQRAHGGVGLRHVTKGKFEETLIELPPFKEQRRIATKIDTLFSELEKGIEALKTAREQLKVYRQALLKHAFEGKLTANWREENIDKLESTVQLLARIRQERQTRYEQQSQGWNSAVSDWERNGKIGKKPSKPRKLDSATELLTGLLERPEGWSSLSVGQLNAEIFDGPFGSNLKGGDYVDSGVRVIRLENIGYLSFIGDKHSYITDEKYLSLIRHTVHAGDLIFSSFITEGIKVAILPEDIQRAVNKADCFCIRLHGTTMRNDFLAAFLSCRSAYKQIEADIHGVGRPRINTSQLKGFVVPVCSPDEQDEIMRQIEKKFSVLERFEVTISEELDRIEIVRQSILKKAFSGQLVPQDPNDEPAAVLLERIRAESGAQNTARKMPKRKLSA